MNNAVIPADQPPAGRLAAEPVVQSPADLDRALAELSWIESRKATEAAALEQQVALFQAASQKRQTVRVGRQNVTFADRAKILHSAIAEYAADHRDELLAAGDGKSWRSTYGVVSWRASRVAVGVADGRKESDVVETVSRGAGLVVKLVGLLARLRFGGVPLSCWLKLTPKLSKSDVLKAYRDERLTAAALAEAGLELRGGDDVLNVAVHEYTAQTEAAA